MSPRTSATIRVVGAVVRRGTKVLVARRPATTRHGGLWEFPGAKVEAGEGDPVALARELQEERAVASRVGEFIAVGKDDRNRLC